MIVRHALVPTAAAGVFIIDRGRDMRIRAAVLWDDCNVAQIVWFLRQVEIIDDAPEQLLLVSMTMQYHSEVVRGVYAVLLYDP